MAAWRKFPCITGLILVLGACGEEARISVAATLTPPLAVEMLTVSVRDGDRLIQWTGSDFRPRFDSPVLSTPEVETRTSGPDLERTFRLEDADAVVSTGTVSLPRKSDWR
jgi:hypothetical protein